MKTTPRDSVTQVVARRITAPEAKRDEVTGKKIAMLGFIDSSAYQRHVPTTKELFLYAASSDSVTAETPDTAPGLDRLRNHNFVVHKNKGGKAIGLDIIPSRLYRSGVIPVSMAGVKTLTVRYELGGAVVRVVQRPFNMRFEHIRQVIQAIDKVIASGKAITTAVRLGGLGRVVNTTDDTVEIRLNKDTQSSDRTPKDENVAVDADDIHEKDD